jgi:hypothetical protein
MYPQNIWLYLLNYAKGKFGESREIVRGYVDMGRDIVNQRSGN